MAKREPKSAYARRNKRAFRYSDQYHNWVRAVATHGYLSDEAEAADIAFRRAHGVPLTDRRLDLSGDLI
jgi:hypothetical protein